MKMISFIQYNIQLYNNIIDECIIEIYKWNNIIHEKIWDDNIVLYKEDIRIQSSAWWKHHQGVSLLLGMNNGSILCHDFTISMNEDDQTLQFLHKRRRMNSPFNIEKPLVHSRVIKMMCFQDYILVLYENKSLLVCSTLNDTNVAIVRFHETIRDMNQMNSFFCMHDFSGSVFEDASSDSDLINIFVVGSNPTLASYRISLRDITTSSTSQITTLTGAVAHQMASVVSNFTAKWTGALNSSSMTTPATKTTNDAAVKTFTIKATNSFSDFNRNIIHSVYSPQSSLCCCTDSLGRILLVNIPTLQIIRLWKGRRDAQCGWIDGSILVFYLPIQRVIEFWPTPFGKCIKKIPAPSDGNWKLVNDEKQEILLLISKDSTMQMQQIQYIDHSPSTGNTSSIFEALKLLNSRHEIFSFLEKHFQQQAEQSKLMLQFLYEMDHASEERNFTLEQHLTVCQWMVLEVSKMITLNENENSTTPNFVRRRLLTLELQPLLERRHQSIKMFKSFSENVMTKSTVFEDSLQSLDDLAIEVSHWKSLLGDISEPESVLKAISCMEWLEIFGGNVENPSSVTKFSSNLEAVSADMKQRLGSFIFSTMDSFSVPQFEKLANEIGGRFILECFCEWWFKIHDTTFFIRDHLKNPICTCLAALLRSNTEFSMMLFERIWNDPSLLCALHLALILEHILQQSPLSHVEKLRKTLSLVVITKSALKISLHVMDSGKVSIARLVAEVLQTKEERMNFFNVTEEFTINEINWITFIPTLSHLHIFFPNHIGSKVLVAAYLSLKNGMEDSDLEELLELLKKDSSVLIPLAVKLWRERICAKGSKSFTLQRIRLALKILNSMSNDLDDASEMQILEQKLSLSDTPTDWPNLFLDPLILELSSLSSDEALDPSVKNTHLIALESMLLYCQAYGTDNCPLEAISSLFPFPMEELFDPSRVFYPPETETTKKAEFFNEILKKNPKVVGSDLYDLAFRLDLPADSLRKEQLKLLYLMNADQDAAKLIPLLKVDDGSIVEILIDVARCRLKYLFKQIKLNKKTQHMIGMISPKVVDWATTFESSWANTTETTKPSLNGVYALLQLILGMCSNQQKKMIDLAIGACETLLQEFKTF